VICYSSSKDKNDFISRFSVLPEKLGHNSSRPLVKKEYWAYLLDVFSEVDKELFIVQRNGADAGRICVNLSAGNPGLAFFGMIEHVLEDESVSSELYELAQEWARKNGATEIIGPIDINVWFGNRFQTEGFDNQYSWAPNNPINYYKAALKNGYREDQGYSSRFFNALKEQVDRTKPGYDLALDEGYSFRHMNLDSIKDITKLYELNVDSFKINYLYEPITKEQYFKTHINFIKGNDLSLSYFIVDKNDVPRGYLYCFLQDDILILKSLLIQKDFQGAKLSSALIHQSCRIALELGYSKGAGVLIRDGNISAKFYEKIGDPYLIHRYHLVKKDIL
jgi:GNAT superfamily N-acetyltransferase